MKCSAFESCTSEAGPLGVCALHEPHERMIRAEEARIAEGLAKYGINGGVLRSVESLAQRIEFASSIDRRQVMATAKAIDKVAEIDEADDEEEEVEDETAADAPATPSTDPPPEQEAPAPVDAPVAAPIEVEQPQPTTVAPPIIQPPKPKRERRPRPPRQAVRPPTAHKPAQDPNLKRCRVLACYNGSGELGLCDGCRPMFMLWRRYTMVNQPSPMTPTAQQEQAFKLLQAELEQKKPA